MTDNTKSVTQRCRQHTCTCCGTHQCKFREIKTDRSCRFAFSNHYINRIVFHRFPLHHLHPFVHLGIHFPTHNLTIERVQSVCIPEDHLFRTIGQQKYLAVLVVLKETPAGNTACRINDILFHNTILQVDDLYILSIFHHTDIFSFRME